MFETNEAVTLLAQVAVLALANYLLVLYLTDTTVAGPLDIFTRIRKLAGIEEVGLHNIETGETDYSVVVADRFWAKVLDCHRCSSPYGAAILILLSWVIGFVDLDLTNLILWLAVSGATIFLHE